MNLLVQSRIRTLLAMLFVITAVVITYVPGLKGPWVFDDDTNIVRNPSVQIDSLDSHALWKAAFSDSDVLSLRPLSRLTIALNHYFSQGVIDTFPYKITNLVIHLINALLVYWLAALILMRVAYRSHRTQPVAWWLPALIALAWALHPLHLSSVLYVVQRMTSLSALFVFAGLVVFMYGRERIEQHRPYGFTLMISGLIAGTALSIGCKENGILLIPLALVVDYLLYSNGPEGNRTPSKLTWLYGGLIGLGALVLGYAWISHPDLLSEAYLNREFTLSQRLFTEPRILLFYLSLLIFPSPQRFGLYHDDIELSTGLFMPWTTLPAIIILLGLVAVAIILRRRLPLFSLAVSWYVVGHSLESSFVGLELAHEHRNYLPSVGFFIGGLYGLVAALQKVRAIIRWTTVGGLLLCLSIATHARAHIWASDEAIIETMAKNHPRSARSQAMLATLYAQRKGNFIEAINHYSHAAILAPHDTSHIMNLVLTSTVANQQPITCQNKTKGLTQTEEMHPASASTDQIGRLKTLLGSLPATTTDLATYITDRLGKGLLTEATLNVLSDLALCKESASQQCAIPYCTLKDWYLAVLQNPHLLQRNRENLTVHLFNHAVDRRDYATALISSRLGSTSDNSTSSYRLMEANTYILLGDIKQAAFLLDALRATPVGLDKETLESIEILEQTIRKRQPSRGTGGK